jgi:hypothetical protein
LGAQITDNFPTAQSEYPFRRLVDEVTIYRRAVSETEIRREIEFDLMRGQTVVDAVSPAGQNGNFVNSAITNLIVSLKVPISTTAFNATNIVVDGPMGRVQASGIVEICDRTYQITFPALALEGAYQFTLLPTYYILVYGDQINGANPYSLLAETAALFLTGITPARHGNATPALVTLSGAGFDETTAVEFLATNGAVQLPGQIEFVSGETLRLHLPLTNWPAGLYTVRATKGTAATNWRTPSRSCKAASPIWKRGWLFPPPSASTSPSGKPSGLNTATTVTSRCPRRCWSCALWLQCHRVPATSQTPSATSESPARLSAHRDRERWSHAIA